MRTIARLGTVVFGLGNGSAEGFLLGFVNVTDSMNGFQLALVNVTRELNGLQVGIVNVARNASGHPVLPIVNWVF
jgi:hypothetical protein